MILAETPKRSRLRGEIRPEDAADQADSIIPSLIEEQLLNNAPCTSRHTICVKPENHPVFMDMYPSHESEDKPNKEVRLEWRKFVGAMTNAGFSASGSGGSAVTVEIDKGGRIISHFHFPFPTSGSKGRSEHADYVWKAADGVVWTR